jgi:hypothetical protein
MFIHCEKYTLTEQEHNQSVTGREGDQITTDRDNSDSKVLLGSVNVMNEYKWFFTEHCPDGTLGYSRVCVQILQTKVM